MVDAHPALNGAKSSDRALSLMPVAPTAPAYPRSAAELSLTAWRSLGDAGRAGASTSLLSIGHLVLELHGVGGGIEEARFVSRAAPCFEKKVDRAESATLDEFFASGAVGGSACAQVKTRVKVSVPRLVEPFPARAQGMGSGAAGTPVAPGTPPSERFLHAIPPHGSEKALTFLWDVFFSSRDYR